MIDVDRLIQGDTQAVELRLDPSALVRAFADVIKDSGALRFEFEVYLHNGSADGRRRDLAIQMIAEDPRVAHAFRLQLDLEEARSLVDDLDAASVKADPCEFGTCTQPNVDGRHCTDHATEAA